MGRIMALVASGSLLGPKNDDGDYGVRGLVVAMLLVCWMYPSACVRGGRVWLLRTGVQAEDYVVFNLCAYYCNWRGRSVGTVNFRSDSNFRPTDEQSNTSNSG